MTGDTEMSILGLDDIVIILPFSDLTKVLLGWVTSVFL